MNIRRILVLGGGFAGLRSALGATRKLDEIGQVPDAVELTPWSTATRSAASACGTTQPT